MFGQRLFAMGLALALLGASPLAFSLQSSGSGSSDQPSQVPSDWSRADAINWYSENMGQGNTGSGGDSMEILPPNFDPSTIRFFGGKKTDCKNMLGGLLKCCKKTPPDQQKAWWSRYTSMQKKLGAGMIAQQMDPSQGAWADIRNGDVSMDTLKKPLTSAFENLTGGGAVPGFVGGRDGAMERMNDKFLAYENEEVKPSLGWYCDDSDFNVAVQKQIGACTYLGSRCQTSVLGVCLVKKEIYCCFNSPISKSIRESLAKQGLGGLGTAKHPQCGGITLTEMQKADFSKVDMGEVVGRMAEGGYLPDTESMSSMSPEELQEQLTGSGSAFGDATRQSVGERTTERLSGIAASGAYDAAFKDAESALPSGATTQDPVGPGQITFRIGYKSVRSGRPVVVSVAHIGTADHAVSVQVASSSGTAVVGRDFEEVGTTLFWSAGDSSAKEVRVQTHSFTGAASRVFKLTLSGATGGASISTHPSATISLSPAK